MHVENKHFHQNYCNSIKGLLFFLVSLEEQSLNQIIVYLTALLSVLYILVTRILENINFRIKT